MDTSKVIHAGTNGHGQKRLKLGRILEIGNWKISNDGYTGSFPESMWRNFSKLFEEATEIEFILKFKIVGDFFDALAGQVQLLLGLQYEPLLNKLRWCFFKVTGATFGKVIRCHGKH